MQKLLWILLFLFMLSGCGESVQLDQNGNMENFKEKEIVNEMIDTKDLQVEIKENNGDIRIILYRDNSEKILYKTIFIQHTNRLKIINLQEKEENILYNKII